jgi:hypothetical protein
MAWAVLRVMGRTMSAPMWNASVSELVGEEGIKRLQAQTSVSKALCAGVGLVSRQGSRCGVLPLKDTCSGRRDVWCYRPLNWRGGRAEMALSHYLLGGEC